MTSQELTEQIRLKKSFLCVGLDVDLEKIPPHLLAEEDPIFAFNKGIIDATADLCVGYKPNTAFYEAYGLDGWKALQKTIDYLNREYPHHFTIADAKRGDIGNTSTRYAKAFFESMNFDSVTVAPYMGIDSVSPFLDFDQKWVILLALTSNQGSQDFQMTPQEGAMPLYEKVMRKAMTWSTADQMMFVVGATHPEKFKEIRAIAPEHFLLVPGIGAQGGDLAKVSEYGWNQYGGLLVNSSRGIIYAGSGEDFADKAREAALHLQTQMADFIASQ